MRMETVDMVCLSAFTTIVDNHTNSHKQTLI
jgi:hypothetical protein